MRCDIIKGVDRYFARGREQCVPIRWIFSLAELWKGTMEVETFLPSSFSPFLFRENDVFQGLIARTSYAPSNRWYLNWTRSLEGMDKALFPV